MRENRRRSELGKIHLARKGRGLDDAVYREILQRVTGKSSAGDLDQAERGKVLDEFKRMGFREGNSHSKRLEDFDDSEPQARLIRCLWSDLHESGVVRDGSDRALQRFIKRTAKVDSIRWLGPHEGNAIIEALKSMKKRGRPT